MFRLRSALNDRLAHGYRCGLGAQALVDAAIEHLFDCAFRGCQNTKAKVAAGTGLVTGRAVFDLLARGTSGATHSHAWVLLSFREESAAPIIAHLETAIDSWIKRTCAEKAKRLRKRSKLVEQLVQSWNAAKHVDGGKCCPNLRYEVRWVDKQGKIVKGFEDWYPAVIRGRAESKHERRLKMGNIFVAEYDEIDVTSKSGKEHYVCDWMPERHIREVTNDAATKWERVQADAVERQSTHPHQKDRPEHGFSPKAQPEMRTHMRFSDRGALVDATPERLFGDSPAMIALMHGVEHAISVLVRCTCQH